MNKQHCLMAFNKPHWIVFRFLRKKYCYVSLYNVFWRLHRNLRKLLSVVLTSKSITSWRLLMTNKQSKITLNTLLFSWWPPKFWNPKLLWILLCFLRPLFLLSEPMLILLPESTNPQNCESTNPRVNLKSKAQGTVTDKSLDLEKSEHMLILPN